MVYFIGNNYDQWKTSSPDDEPPVHYCNKCKGEIYVDEIYYDFGDGPVCESCVDDCRHVAEWPDDPCEPDYYFN